MFFKHIQYLITKIYIIGPEVPQIPESHDGIDGEMGKVLLVLSEKFGAERGSGDVHKILTEFIVIGAVVTRSRRQRLTRNVRGLGW